VHDPNTTPTQLTQPRQAAAPIQVSMMAWTVVSIAAATFIVDRLAKMLAQNGNSMLGGLIRMEPAAAQNLVNNGLAIGAELIGIALCALIMLFWDAERRGRAHAVAFGLIIGGLAANLFDRVTNGSIMNYIHLGNLPVFNVAHVALLVGALVLTYAILTGRSRGALATT
jgi:lipoprotein signal peptidase